MKSALKNLLMLVIAFAVFAWMYDVFFDDEFIDFGEKKAAVGAPGDIPLALPDVQEQPERFEHRPLQPAQQDPGGAKPSAKLRKELASRAMSDDELRRKQEKWEAFYQESPKCKARDGSWQVAVECANELLRANEEFERLYREGKL